jgi:Flp pilus assembly protein TadD
LAPATLLRAMALIPIEKWSDAMRLLRLAIKAGLTNEAAALAASLIQNDAFVRSRAFLIEFSRLTPRLIDRGLARVIVASLLSRADESDPAQIRAEQPIIEDLAVALGKTADEAMLAASAISHDRYRRKKVALLVAAAQILAALDDVGEAARTATTAAAMLTVWDETNLVLARLFFDLDRQEDGIAMARRAMACQPDDIKPYGLIAGAMERKGDWQSAATIWAEAFAIGRETPRIAHRLARAWFQLRDFRQALAVIGVGLVADPHQAGLLRLQWQSLQRLGEFAAASASLERLIALTPDDAVAHHALSGMFERLGRDADAAAAARKAVTLEPDNPRFSARLEAIEARR